MPITVKIASSIDGEIQPAKLYRPRTGKKIPLAIGLHQWSSGYDEMDTFPKYLGECRKRKWALIFPHFRGRNDNPSACASPLAIQDVLDAAEYARSRLNIDEKKIYLIGTSGGGHMAMMIAGKNPDMFSAISVWVGISDIKKWYYQTREGGMKYWKMIEPACGGVPGSSKKTDREYRDRSPIHFLQNASETWMDINAGIHDGHTGSVPVSQSIEAFNRLAVASDCGDRVISKRDIDEIVATQKIPAGLESFPCNERRKHKGLFRREAGKARITIFEGGHEVDAPCAFSWFDGKSK